MIVLGIDLETTGLDPEKDKITEIGYALYDLTRKRSLLKQNMLIFHGHEFEVPAEITELTGIDSQMIKDFGIGESLALEVLEIRVRVADFVMAHNCAFEKDFLRPKIPDLITEIPWIDTRIDLPFPKRIQTRKLQYLASEHGIYVKRAHRALEDVETMLELASMYDVNDILELQKSPTLEVKALVDFHNKDLAKDAGFHWNPDRKEWLMNIKELYLEDMEKNLAFKIRRI